MSRCNGNTTVIHLGKTQPHYCGCGYNSCKCNSGGSSGSGGIPSGGSDGNILVKSGDKAVWATSLPGSIFNDGSISADKFDANFTQVIDNITSDIAENTEAINNLSIGYNNTVGF